MKWLIPVVLLLALPALGAYVLEIGGLPEDQQLAAVAFQGLANRQGPQVWISNNRQGSWAHEWPGTDAYWLEYYSTHKGLAFQQVQNLGQLIDALPHVAKGLVVYDPSSRTSRSLAATLAGLEELIPVSPFLAGVFGEKLPVLRDLQDQFGPDPGLTPLQWGVKELLPLTDRSLAYSLGGGVRGLDYIVMRGGFVYHLEYNESELVEGGQLIPARPKEAALIDEILRGLQPLAHIYGWGGPTETTVVRRIAQNGHLLLCNHQPGLSFHAQVPAGELRQPAHLWPQEQIPLESKVYLAFLAAEGDTPKILQSVYAGHWTDPNRGEIPLAWGIPPTVASDFPALLEHYYLTATENDTFIAGPSGAGYVHLRDLKDLPAYAQKTQSAMELADLKYTEAWGASQEALKVYLENAPIIEGFSQFADDFGVSWVQGVPVIRRPLGKTPRSEMELLEFLEDLVEEWDLPAFLIYYWDFHTGLTRESFSDSRLPREIPSFLAEVAQMLDPRVFEIVSIGQLMDLAQRYGEVQISPEWTQQPQGGQFNLRVTLTPGQEIPLNGSISIQAPLGWEVLPARRVYSGLGQSQEFTFRIQLPLDASVGEESILIRVAGDEGTFSTTRRLRVRIQGRVVVDGRPAIQIYSQDFSTGLVGWETLNYWGDTTGRVGVGQGLGRDGGPALTISKVSTTLSVASPRVDLEPGQGVALSAWVKTQGLGGKSAYLEIKFFGPGGFISTRTSSMISKDTPWTHTLIRVPAAQVPPGATWMTVNATVAHGGATEGSAYFDEFTLYQLEN